MSFQSDIVGAAGSVASLITNKEYLNRLAKNTEASEAAKVTAEKAKEEATTVNKTAKTAAEAVQKKIELNSGKFDFNFWANNPNMMKSTYDNIKEYKGGASPFDLYPDNSKNAIALTNFMRFNQDKNIADIANDTVNNKIRPAKAEQNMRTKFLYEELKNRGVNPNRANEIPIKKRGDK